MKSSPKWSLHDLSINFPKFPFRHPSFIIIKQFSITSYTSNSEQKNAFNSSYHCYILSADRFAVAERSRVEISIIRNILPSHDALIIPPVIYQLYYTMWPSFLPEAPSLPPLGNWKVHGSALSIILQCSLFPSPGSSGLLFHWDDTKLKVNIGMIIELC